MDTKFSVIARLYFFFPSFIYTCGKYYACVYLQQGEGEPDMEPHPPVASNIVNSGQQRLVKGRRWPRVHVVPYHAFPCINIRKPLSLSLSLSHA